MLDSPYGVYEKTLHKSSFRGRFWVARTNLGASLSPFAIVFDPSCLSKVAALKDRRLQHEWIRFSRTIARSGRGSSAPSSGLSRRSNYVQVPTFQNAQITESLCPNWGILGGALTPMTGRSPAAGVAVKRFEGGSDGGGTRTTGLTREK